MDAKILGYNIFKFDLRFIFVRLFLSGKMDEGLWSLLYDRNWIDLYQLLGDHHRSLDFWLAKFNIERTCSVKGCEIPGLFEKEHYDQIIQHAVDDLIACEKLYTKIGESCFGRLIP